MKNKKNKFFQERKIIHALINKIKDLETQISAKDIQIKKLKTLNRTLKSYFNLPQKPQQEDTQLLRDEITISSRDHTLVGAATVFWDDED